MSWMILEVGKNQRHMMAIKVVFSFKTEANKIVKLYGRQIKFVARTRRLSLNRYQTNGEGHGATIKQVHIKN